MIEIHLVSNVLLSPPLRGGDNLLLWLKVVIPLVSGPLTYGTRSVWKGGIEGDFMVILLISLAFEIHFSKS